MSVVRKILKFPFRIIKQHAMLTTWWKSRFVDPDHHIYPDNVWYRAHEERNFDVVNLGSSASKWAFCYDNLPIKAMNWAQQPQSLVDDYRLLQNFHSILKKGGNVLIVIMPFSSLNKKNTVLNTLRYVGTLDYTLLDLQYRDEACALAKNPVAFGKKKTLKQGLKHLLGRDKGDLPYIITERSLSHTQLSESALQYIRGWKKEFNIIDFDAPLTPENIEGRKYRKEVLKDIISFCEARSYNPIIVLPPISSQLNECFSDTFKEVYIYSFIRESCPYVKLLDYMTDERFIKDENFYDSLLLNHSASEEFTRQVLTDLELIQI